LPLNPGTNIVTITATDAAGNPSVTNLTFIRSGVMLTINTVPDSQLNQSVTTVSGTVSDPSYNVWINGVQATVNGSGNWTADNVPVYGNGTATFDAIAYPPGQSPNLRARMNANNDKSPVQTSQAKEQPPTFFVSSYSDNWEEEMTSLGGYGPYHISWGISKNYAATSGSSGQLSYQGNGTFFYHDDVSDGTGWWDTSYNWSSDDPIGTFVRTGEGYDAYDDNGDSGTGCGDCWNPTPYAVPSWSWGCGSHYYANINYDWNQQPCFDAIDLTYSRSSQTSMTLKTGGKSGITHRNLFRIGASVTEYGRPNCVSWGNGPEEWDGTPASNINPTQIHILGKNVGNDGNLFIVLPDNATLDLGASAPGRHYSLGVGATKHKFTVTANGNNLETTSPEFCVGQRVTFSPRWSPSAPPNVANTLAHWHLPDKFVNEQFQYSPTCTSYRRNDDLLTNQTTSCWYVNGNGGTAGVWLNLQFSNGQTVSMAAMGNFTIFKPAISLSQAANVNPSFYVGQKLYSFLPYVKLGGDDDPRNDGPHDMEYDIFYNAGTYSGTGGIVQLLTMNYSGPTGPVFSDWRLDGSTVMYTTNSIAPSQPINAAFFYDSPGNGHLYVPWGTIRCKANFEDYCMFKPSGGIYVPLGIVTWSCHGESPDAGILGVNSVVGPDGPDGSDDFPVWLLNFPGGSKN
jgi:hypothetical protein